MKGINEIFEKLKGIKHFLTFEIKSILKQIINDFLFFKSSKA